MPAPGEMLTDPAGPIVVGEKTLAALVAIRREKLLPLLYDRPILIGRSNRDALANAMPDTPEWLQIAHDQPLVTLPERCATATPSEAATLRLALACPASVVLLEGPIKERAKLSFIKAEGTLAILVAAYRRGHISAVRPMVKALEALGHGDVLPAPDLMNAMWEALEGLRDE